MIETVEELIEYLKTFPPDAKLVVTYDSGYGTDAVFVKEHIGIWDDGKLHIEVS